MAGYKNMDNIETHILYLGVRGVGQSSKRYQRSTFQDYSSGNFKTLFSVRSFLVIF